jgi:Putative metal-binding motif
MRLGLYLGVLAAVLGGACGGTSHDETHVGGGGPAGGSNTAGVNSVTGGSGVTDSGAAPGSDGGSGDTSSGGATFAIGGAAPAGECLPADVRDCGSSIGACKLGVQTCSASGHWTACVNQVEPTAEVCDGIDNDCNGQVDDGLSAQCPSGCEAGVCRLCTAGQAKCLTANSAGVCLASTAAWDETACSLGCNEVSGKCNVCKPGSTQCFEQQGVAHSTTQQTCRADGSGFDNLDCQPLQCSETTGKCQICKPGDHRCVGTDSEQVCTPDGTQPGLETACTLMFGCTEHIGCNACQPFTCFCSDPVIPSPGEPAVMSATSDCSADGQISGSYFCRNNGEGNCVDGECELTHYNSCHATPPAQ